VSPDVVQCGLEENSRCFGGHCCLHFQAGIISQVIFCLKGRGKVFLQKYYAFIPDYKTSRMKSSNDLFRDFTESVLQAPGLV
jgi:uncharacterized Fe-S cluster protein YjdI